MTENDISSGRQKGKDPMNDRELEAYLRDNGYAEHVCRAGRKGLVDRWTKFVDEVEAGYELGLEDYRNDLDLRAIIAMAGLEADAQGADKRLKALLTGTDKRVWESSHENAFWDYGYPRNASGDLLEDLKAEGLT
jgi:hypothetical protein